MRFFQLFIFIITFQVLSGCARDRAQAAADAWAGIDAVMAAYAAGEVTDEVVQILRGAAARLPAASGVNSADWPKPTISPHQIRANPKAYLDTAPPEPSRNWGMAALITAGVGLLGVARLLAPLIPGGGPLVKAAADLAWSVMAHKDQKTADAVASTVQQAAVSAKPLLDALRAQSLDSLPPALREALQHPTIAMAIDTLATKPRPQNV